MSSLDFVMGLFTLNADALMYVGVAFMLLKFVYTTYVEHPKTYAESNSVVAIMKTHHFHVYLEMRAQYVKRIMQLHSKHTPTYETYVALCTSPLFPSSAIDLMYEVAEGGDETKRTELVKILLTHYVTGGEDTTPCESL